MFFGARFLSYRVRLKEWKYAGEMPGTYRQVVGVLLAILYKEYKCESLEYK